MQLPQSIVKKGLLIIALPAMLQLAFGIGLALLEDKTAAAERRAGHSKDLLYQLGNVENDMYNITMAVVQLTIERKVATVATFDQGKENALRDLEAMTPLVANDDQQRPNIRHLQSACHTYLDNMSSCVEALKSNDSTQLKLLAFGLRKQMLEFGGLENRAFQPIRALEEERIKDDPAIARDLREKLRSFILLGLGLNTLAALAASIVFLRDIAFRVRRISRNAESLGIGQEMMPALTGKDEIAKLDRVLHKMAGHLKDSSRRETALVSNAADVILCLDKALLIVTVNKACLANFGYAIDDLLGKRLMSLVPDDRRDEAHRLLHNAMKESTSVHADIDIICKSGEVRNFNWNVLWSSEDEMLFCVAHDVSEARRIERVKQDFVNMVSHDLRTPLTGISAFVEMLELEAYGILNEVGKERAGEVSSALVRLMNMVNELLEIEKMQSGKLELRMREVEAQALLTSCVQLVHGFAEQQRVQIEPRCTAGKVICDEARIVQVLQNLVSNAVKHSRPESVVAVSICQEGAGTRFDVVDNGAGIAKEDLGRLFDRFTQLQGADGAPRSGYGLGLAICKEVVDGHRGSIDVESEVGKGSRFWFTIPG